MPRGDHVVLKLQERSKLGPACHQLPLQTSYGGILPNQLHSTGAVLSEMEKVIEQAPGVELDIIPGKGGNIMLQ